MQYVYCLVYCVLKRMHWKQQPSLKWRPFGCKPVQGQASLLLLLPDLQTHKHLRIHLSSVLTTQVCNNFHMETCHLKRHSKISCPNISIFCFSKFNPGVFLCSNIDHLSCTHCLARPSRQCQKQVVLIYASPLQQCERSPAKSQATQNPHSQEENHNFPLKNVF